MVRLREGRGVVRFGADGPHRCGLAWEPGAVDEGTGAAASRPSGRGARWRERRNRGAGAA
ncbi:hypothetical protein Saso_24010 [Streptomyces asoensis]|uniref:Uncharacterized protein n=1 Tax=Streptomyces asoensis TaxID=249586 RepID=A0ABQ3RY31_9ACTN|nr:hypothetical protein GCM10010496_16600 [Streptomyces asoensis]GHI60751.1 hypothetical protein Saso_24010 [Streptomyces asoensis]